MTDDQLTRARATLARLADDWTTDPRLLALAEAATRMTSIYSGDDDDGAWWIMGGVEVGEARTWCLVCGAEGPDEAAHYAELIHAPDCPAVAIDAALAALAALDGDEPGEVGA